MSPAAKGQRIKPEMMPACSSEAQRHLRVMWRRLRIVRSQRGFGGGLSLPNTLSSDRPTVLCTDGRYTSDIVCFCSARTRNAAPATAPCRCRHGMGGVLAGAPAWAVSSVATGKVVCDTARSARKASNRIPWGASAGPSVAGGRWRGVLGHPTGREGRDRTNQREHPT